MKNAPIPAVLLIALISLIACTGSGSKTGTNRALAAELEHSLKNGLLNTWYPRAIDTVYGGFLSDFSYDFKPAGPQNKMIVTQARHTWTNAKAALLYPGEPQFAAQAQHGFRFLKNVMWDSAYGGFFTLVTREGVAQPKDSVKTAYGNAFGIFALAACYAASRDAEALDLAKHAFHWLERGSHDRVYGGYFQHLNRSGAPLKRPAGISSTSDFGYKDQNSSIHLLEAFAELYQVWPDSLLKIRLAELLILIRDKIVTPRGNLTLFLQPDWTPVSFRDSARQTILEHTRLDHLSFGHDVETAYLLLEASHVLGLKHDTLTERVAKKMLDQALRDGWDEQTGGFYDEGYCFKDRAGVSILRDSKNWWAQAEGLNTLLLMSRRYPADAMQYDQKFKKQWHYIKTYLLDPEHGDWYAGGLDKEPAMKTAPKGHIWKGNYHQFRSLANCIAMLRQE